MEHAQREKLTKIQKIIVLILILMEHAQREAIQHYVNRNYNDVLILILMEHAQRDIGASDQKANALAVLILILMEHAQRGVVPLTVVTVPLSVS